MRRPLATLLLVLTSVPLVACGGTNAADGEPDATVYAAASLKEVLPAALGAATYSFAGSDALALQIREGAPADLFVAASPRYPRELADEGLCEPPVGFASNTLALIVPAAEPAGIDDIGDLLEGGPYRLAIGAETVPIGAYTRAALANLDAEAVLERNTVSLEPDPPAIVAKVALGSADAGIVYATDARASDDRVQAIPLPPGASPTIAYTACVVKRPGAATDAAQALLDHLRSPTAQTVLEEAGFGPAP